jgi:hypothetical protein
LTDWTRHKKRGRGKKGKGKRGKRQEKKTFDVPRHIDLSSPEDGGHWGFR